MTEFAICFDFPEGGDPWFAALVKDGLGLTTDLSSALTWKDEVAAINTLRNGYGDETRRYGVVVEMGQ